MKTLILNGSPRDNGDSMFLVNKLCEHLEGEKIIINTYDKGYGPCVDCRWCWKNKGCVIQDDMQDIYQLLDEVDNVILSSPLYFSELTGGLLSFASRFQTFFVERVLKEDGEFNLRSKNGALILVGGGDTRDLERSINTAKTIFRHINTEHLGEVMSLKTMELPTSMDEDAIKSVMNIANVMNQLFE